MVSYISRTLDFWPKRKQKGAAYPQVFTVCLFGVLYKDSTSTISLDSTSTISIGLS